MTKRLPTNVTLKKFLFVVHKKFHTFIIFNNNKQVPNLIIRKIIFESALPAPDNSSISRQSTTNDFADLCPRTICSILVDCARD